MDRSVRRRAAGGESREQQPADGTAARHAPLPPGRWPPPRRAWLAAAAACLAAALVWASLASRKKGYIDRHYANAKKTRSDINQHIPTLYRHAREGATAAELGVRKAVATFALLRGLRDSSAPGRKRLLCLDVDQIHAFHRITPEGKKAGVEVTFVRHNSANYTLPFTVDLLFIDTWHVYGHLKRELAQHHARVRRYIIAHDTTVDGETLVPPVAEGESVRNRNSELPWMEPNITKAAAALGYPEDEVTHGLWPAIDEFLGAHGDEWALHKRYTHNNGLTILRRTKLLPQQQDDKDGQETVH
eukprot:scaffold5.g818.t1